MAENVTGNYTTTISRRARHRLLRAGQSILVAVLGGLPAQAAATTANDLCLPTANPCIVGSAVAVTSGSRIDVGGRELRIVSGGALDVGGGSMTLVAATLAVDVGGALRALGSSSLPAGSIAVTAGDITIAGSVDASGIPGGDVTLSAERALVVTGPMAVRSLQREEDGGRIALRGETVSISGMMSTLGGPDAFGGDIDVSAVGNLAVSSALDASGGDGGAVSLDAGAFPGAGNLTIMANAQIKADATLGGGFGGTIELSATGDGTATGHIAVDGLISAEGQSGSSDLGGGVGGCISLLATGNIRSDASTTLISVEGGAPDGDGGEVEFVTDLGLLNMRGAIDFSCPGTDSSGGTVAMDIAADVTLGGTLTGTAGTSGGGEVSIESAQSTVVISNTGSIDVSGRSGGPGGLITITGGSEDSLSATSVRIGGSLIADGGGGSSAGGVIDLEGADSVNVTAPIRANGGSGGGSGGTISVLVDPGPALIENTLSASGSGNGGVGGIVTVEAESRVSVTAAIDASGQGGNAGRIGISSAGPVDVVGNLMATTTGTGLGGRIEIISENDVIIGGTVATDGGSGGGARIAVQGCTVTVCGLDGPDCPPGQTAVLSSLGTGGLNRVIGRDLILVLGTIRANPTSGRNELVFDGSAEREPAVLGTVSPTQILEVDPTLLPCPVCGNGMTESPETCDDRNQLDGDGCSADCQIGDVAPGDVNGDAMVTRDDVRFLISEIFDGDGDTVATVSSGTLPFTPGADANTDGRITAADIAAIIGLLGAP